MRRAPTPIARANASPRAERTQDLGAAVRCDERCAARYLCQRAISELHGKAHAIEGERESYLPFAASAESSAPATSASALASFVAPMMNVGVEITPAFRARS